MSNPAIHNLYMDFGWDSDNPDAISRANIDDFTQRLTIDNYFDDALQYAWARPRSPGRTGAPPSTLTLPFATTADYSFYSGLVSSLGGTVLPPC